MTCWSSSAALIALSLSQRLSGCGLIVDMVHISLHLSVTLSPACENNLYLHDVQQSWHSSPLRVLLVVQRWGFYLYFVSVLCCLGEFHTLLRPSVWVLLLHYAETAIKQNSLVATFPFTFSSMSSCWYKLPPRVTLQILNTCLALINSPQVFQAPWNCCLGFIFFCPVATFLLSVW